MMHTLASGLSYLDLDFQGRPRVIATAVFSAAQGVALVDPGPSSSLPVLRSKLLAAGITMKDVTALLITHIHLDHAGAAGTLVRDNPALKVYVHENGAPHMINPERLLASAARLYGDAMDRLWAEVLPVPASALTILKGGERIDEGGRSLEVAYTPGHASHHVSYFAADAGIAFVGDTAGVKVVPDGEVLPPTPPPDIDLEAWDGSLKQFHQWGPDTLFLTHFGPVDHPSAHLSVLRDRLDASARLVKMSLDRDGTDADREAWFIEESRRELRRRMTELDAQTEELASRFDLSWRGLARYWRKKE
jgi:glyoxylase-like metal-dependent hydrolase (beta-lactamase superfamily II)